ncbi:MAG TPA: hypothetical protein VL500_04985 [Candidatus Eisenbacteria bacterium]|nr:hypothetical protein [Candidatus Eisenbacteria bacterium]
MAEAARDLSRQEAQDESKETERAKPELRIVREASPEEADGMLDKMVEEFESTADSGTQEMRQDAAAFGDFAEKQGGLNAEEANDNNAITERAEAAATTLKSEIAAATGPAADAEAKLRGLEAQYKTASGDQKKALERQMEEATAAWQEALAAAKKTETAPAESAPAATKTEAKIVPDFGQLLEHLSPEAQKLAADNFANADETSYGGMISKGMTPDGVVRVGYKDGTIVETFPGGQKRSNRPEATGAERIPSLPDWAKEAENDADSGVEGSLLLLEDELVQDKEELYALESGAGVQGSEARRAELRGRIKNVEAAIARKNTPDGLSKEIADLNRMIADQEADLNLAPESEKAGYVDRIEGLKAQIGTLEDRKAVLGANERAADYAEAIAPDKAAEKAPERAPASERKARMQQLETTMRELEEKKKAAGTPDEKSAIDRQMQEATDEWDGLRKDWTAEDEKNVLEETQKEMKANRILALEASMREMEGRLKAASSPDEKAAIGRELESATREWDALRKESDQPSAPEAVAEAVAVAAAAETLAAAEKTPDAEKTEEQKEQVKAAEEVIATKSPAGKAAKKTKYAPPGGDYSKGGGGGDKAEKSGMGKKLEEAWGWAQKFFGGWTGIK